MRGVVLRLTGTFRRHQDWSLSLQVFICLQVLDFLTTWMGFHMGLSEASPFVRLLMEIGSIQGVLFSNPHFSQYGLVAKRGGWQGPPDSGPVFGWQFRREQT